MLEKQSTSQYGTFLNIMEWNILLSIHIDVLGVNILYTNPITEAVLHTSALSFNTIEPSRTLEDAIRCLG